MAHHASVNYVEPNVSAVGKTGNRDKSGNIENWKVLDYYNRSPRLEDYCITLNLEVEVCSRDNITSSGNKTTDVLILTYRTNHKEGKVDTVNFMGGTKVVCSDKERSYMPYLTTNYADMYVGDLIDYGTTEMIGVKSVNIQYQKSCVPIINIVFTDVRGLSLFQPSELSRSNMYDGIKGLNIDNVAQSFFQCFFRVPMPKFTITIKGFYGKPVTYEVMCDKFDTKFNSNTGDFDINTRFIGYSYSFMTDISMDALISAPYSDYIGGDYWRDKVADGTFTLKGKNGETKPMPTLVECMTDIDKILAETYSDQITGFEDEQAFHAEQIDDLTNIRTMYQKWYTNLYDILCERLGKDYCFLFKEEGSDGDYTRIVILSKLIPSTDGGSLKNFYETLPDDFKRLNEKLYTAINEYNKKANGGEETVYFYPVDNVSVDFDDYEFQYLFNKLFVNGDGKIIFNGFHRGNTLPETEMMQGIFYGVEYEQDVQRNRELHKNYILEKIYNDGVNQYVYCYSIAPSYKTVKSLINALQDKDMNSSNATADYQRNKKLNDAIYGQMKWYPTVENFTRIMLAHLETLMEMMYVTIDKMEGRTAEELGVTSGAEGICNDVNPNSKDEIPPFPRVSRNILGDDNIVKREDTWVGEYQGGGSRLFEEINLINGLLNGMDYVKSYVDATNATINDIVAARNAEPERPKNIIKYPLAPFDFILERSPYGNSDEISNNLEGYDFAGKVAIRMFNLMVLSNYNVSYSNNWQDPTIIANVAKTEAYNFKKLVTITNPDFLSRLKNDQITSDFIISAVTTSNSDPNCPWGSDILFSIDNDMLWLDGYAVEHGTDGKPRNWAFPMQNVSFANRQEIMAMCRDNKIVTNGGDYSYAKIIGSKQSLKGTDDNTGLGTIFITDNINYNKEALSNANDINDSENCYDAIYNRTSEMIEFDNACVSKYAGVFRTYASTDVRSVNKRLGTDAEPIITEGYVYDASSKQYILTKRDGSQATYSNTQLTGIGSEAKNGSVDSFVITECFTSMGDSVGSVSSYTFSNAFDYNSSFLYRYWDTFEVMGNAKTITYNGYEFDVYHLAFILGIHVDWNFIKNDENGYHVFDYAYNSGSGTFKYGENSFYYLPRIVLLQLGAAEILYQINKGYVPINNTNGKNAVLRIMPVPTFLTALQLGSPLNIPARQKTVDYLYNWISANKTLLDSFKISDTELGNIMIGALSVSQANTKYKTVEDVKAAISNTPYAIPKEVGATTPYRKKFLFNENSSIVKSISRELLSSVSVDFLTIYHQTEIAKYYMKKSGRILKVGQAKTYLDAFLTKLKTIYGIYTEVKDDNGNLVRISKEPTNATEDIKKELYRYLKQVYDKWIPMNPKEFWSMNSFFEDRENSGHNFYFIDSFYNYIGDKLLINPKYLSEKLNALLSYKDINTMMLGFMGDIYALNRCMMMSIQNFFDLKKPGSMDEMFSMKSFNEIEWNSLHKTPSFVVVYPYEPSKNLDIPNNEYINDGFMLNDENETPIAVKTKSNKAGQYNIPAFGVSYGKQYQSYFKSININMESPVATQQSIQAKHYILQESAGTSPSNKAVAAQDLFDIYSTQSYTCEVEMMGCAWVQPLMYFVLLNVPMFKGSYMIMKVEHSITPGNMTTKFTGCRMANVSTKFVENIFSDELRGDAVGGGSQANGIDKTQLAASDNDCPYKVYPLYGTEELSGDFVEKGLQMMTALIAKGLNPTGAAGVAGNIAQECGFNPYTANTDSDGYIAGGLCGWNDHYGCFTDMITNNAAGYGQDYNRSETDGGHNKQMAIDKLKAVGLQHQIDFIIDSIPKVRPSISITSLNGSATPEAAAASFRASYEKGDNLANRQKYARQLYDAYSQNGGTVQVASAHPSGANNQESLNDAFFNAVQKSCNSTPSISVTLKKQILNNVEKQMRISADSKVAEVFDLIVSTPSYMQYVKEIYWEISDNPNPNPQPDPSKEPVSISVMLSETVRPEDRRIHICYQRANDSSGYIDVLPQNINVKFHRSMAKRRIVVNDDNAFVKECKHYSNNLNFLDGYRPTSCDSIVSTMMSSMGGGQVTKGSTIACVGDSWMAGYCTNGQLTSKLTEKGFGVLAKEASTTSSSDGTYKVGANGAGVKNFVTYAVNTGCDVIVINCGLNNCLDYGWVESVGKACGDKQVFFCTVPHNLNNRSSSCDFSDSKVDEFNSNLKQICNANNWGVINVGSLTVSCTDYHPNGESYKKIASYIADYLGGAVQITQTMDLEGFSGLVTNEKMKRVLQDVSHYYIRHQYSTASSRRSVKGSGSNDAPFDSGKCTYAPSTWYNNAGIDLHFYPGPAEANHTNTILGNYGMKMVWHGTVEEALALPNSKFRPGDVSTQYYFNSRNQRSAHGCMWTGHDWRSDFVQRTIMANTSFKGRDGNYSVCIWRHPDFQEPGQTVVPVT